MTKPELREWRNFMQLSQLEASKMLGISHRMYLYYESAENYPVPRKIELACISLMLHGSTSYAEAKKQIPKAA